MSWNLEIIGSEDACKKAVDKEETIPLFVKEYLLVAIEMCASIATKFEGWRAPQKWGVHLRSFGHIDDQNFQNETVVRPVRTE